MRAGRLHALEAYRFFNDNLGKKGRLSPEEQATYDRAAQALAEAMGRESRAADTAKPADRRMNAWRQEGSSMPDAQAADPEEAASQRASRASAVDPGAAALPTRNAVRPVNRPLGTRSDVHAAATAPDARKRLGLVRAGTLHALEAYRFLSDKLRKMGRLAPAEKVKYERAAQALAEAVGRERSGSYRQGSDVSNPSAGGDPAPIHRTPRESDWEYSESYEAMIRKLESLIEPVAQVRRALAEASASADEGARNLTRPGGTKDFIQRLKAKEAARAQLESLLEECRRLVEVPTQLRGTIRLRGDARVLDRAREGLDITARYTARSLLPKDLEVVYSKDGRAWHERGRIHINESTRPDVAAHEITHETEIFGKDILFRTTAFLTMRASGTSLVNLKDYTGRDQYSSNERAWEDRWEELGGTIYSGKDCGGRATEILTTGIQRLHADPLLFLLTDPEYFEFVTRTLNPP